MRIVAAALLAIGVLGLVPAATSANPKPKPSPLGAPRILYTSDWSGTSQVYAVDPSGASPPGQLTFGRARACGVSVYCGYSDPVPSPDGTMVVFQDYGTDPHCFAPGSSLYLARADGTHRRSLAGGTGNCELCNRQTFCYGYRSAVAWSPDSRRVAYTSDSGRDVHIVGVGGGRDRDLGVGRDPAWSPTRGSLAFLSGKDVQEYPTDLTVVQAHTTGRVLGHADAFAWSPDGRWIAYTCCLLTDALFVARPDGSGRRVLSRGLVGHFAWSADGRFIAFEMAGSVGVVDVVSREVEVLAGGSWSSSCVCGTVIAWSPKGHTLAVGGIDGVELTDPATSVQSLLTPEPVQEAAWSPDGHSLAYVADTAGETPAYRTGDLKVASVDSDEDGRTIVAAAGDHGGNITGIAWVQPPSAAHYLPAAPRTVASVSGDELVAPWPITRIAADADRVAYVSCNHVFVWRPATGSVVQAEPVASLSPSCAAPGFPSSVYSLAAAGHRVGFGVSEILGSVTAESSIYAGTAAGSFVTLDNDDSPACGRVLGDLAGSGGLLVFSTWTETGAGCGEKHAEQQIERVEPAEYGGFRCIWHAAQVTRPCPTLAASLAGPLVPFDVNKGRVVAGTESATVLFDRNGRQLLSVTVAPLAAQLSGSDLVVLVQGELRDYDAATGKLLHAWPLHRVPSGAECGGPLLFNGFDCRYIRPPRLLLEDVARSLATYVLDGQVHLLRLSDGADAVVGAGRLSRFMDAGLVYADGSRLHLVPFNQLPLQ